MNHQKEIAGSLRSDESAVKNLGVVDLSQVKTVDDLLAKDGPLKQMFKGTLEKMLKAESFKLSSAFSRWEQYWQQSEREKSQNP